jgi:hypothetical protein
LIFVAGCLRENGPRVKPGVTFHTTLRHSGPDPESILIFVVACLRANGPRVKPGATERLF